MFTKEVNERSPLRVFEKSIHGGLGKGNLGVVMSRAGVGKTAFLIGIAMDDLMRGRKVLHLSSKDSVDHVREFYDEVFEELRRSVDLADAAQTRLDVERSRMIHTYRGVPFTVDKIRSDVAFYKEHVHFEPEVVIIDGFDYAAATEADFTALRDLAKTAKIEIWLSALTHREDLGAAGGGIPKPVARFEPWISVVVNLEPNEGAVSLRLLKDHDSEKLDDLHIRLDPRTLLIKQD